MVSAFVKNYLWPSIMACLFAIVTALTTNAPALLADGFDATDWAKMGGIALSAALGYVATIMTRYGGNTTSGHAEPWTSPPK